MPAKSKKQQQFFGAELARKRKGQKTETGLDVEEIKKFAGTPTKNLPTRVKPRKSKT
jgi:hypothetical protein